MKTLTISTKPRAADRPQPRLGVVLCDDPVETGSTDRRCFWEMPPIHCSTTRGVPAWRWKMVSACRSWSAPIRITLICACTVSGTARRAHRADPTGRVSSAITGSTWTAHRRQERIMGGMTAVTDNLDWLYGHIEAKAVDVL